MTPQSLLQIRIAFLDFFVVKHYWTIQVNVSCSQVSLGEEILISMRRNSMKPSHLMIGCLSPSDSAVVRQKKEVESLKQQIMQPVFKPQRFSVFKLPRLTEERAEPGSQWSAERELELSHLTLKQPGKDICTVTERAEVMRVDKAWQWARGWPGVLHLLHVIVPNITANLGGSTDRWRILALQRSSYVCSAYCQIQKSSW